MSSSESSSDSGNVQVLDSSSESSSSEEKIKVVKKKKEKSKSDAGKKKDKSVKPDVKCKWEKLNSDGQETGQAIKHHCSEEKKVLSLQWSALMQKEDIKPETSVGVSAVMEFPSISTGK